MAIEGEHLTLAGHNVQLATELASQPGMPYKDWVITVTFYAAVHYVEARLGKRFGWHGEKITGDSPHTARLRKLKDAGYPLNCQRAYEHLRNASQNVRYLLVPASHYSEADVLTFLQDDLQDLRGGLGYR